jgi:CspA family cold shock protein
MRPHKTALMWFAALVALTVDLVWGGVVLFTDYREGGFDASSCSDPKGTVKWFNEAKGFGFIVPDDGTEDLFVNFSEIQIIKGNRTIEEGQRVCYEITQSSKGKMATNVSVFVERPSITPR